MTKNPACCTPDSPLQEVAHMMEMYDCGCIPVIENHQTKRPIGTVTDRDITIRTFSQNKNPLEMKASDIMTTDIATVTPETTVADCMKKMEDEEIRRILVVDKSGKCVGIVAQADLLEHGPHLEQTAHFIREVSESDEQDRQSETTRTRSNDKRSASRRNDYSFEENEGQEIHGYVTKNTRPQRRTEKRRSEKESFLNSTTLLALLGSVALGAGLRYYLGPETETKTITLKDRTKTPAATLDLTNNTSSSAAASLRNLETTPVSTGTNLTGENDTFTGNVDSFNTTIDDKDLDPIKEVGRTASNRNG